MEVVVCDGCQLCCEVCWCNGVCIMCDGVL